MTSPRDFEARMATLLRRQRRRRHWRALLAAAAVLGALAAGLSVGAGDRTDCQIYWSQTDGELRYVIRLEHATTPAFPGRPTALCAGGLHPGPRQHQ